MFHRYFISFAAFYVLLTALPFHSAQAFKMTGLVSYSLSQFQNRPSNYQSSGNGIGYGFFGNIPFGPGEIESGFHYLPTSMTTAQTSVNLVTSGSYWTLPILYRIHFYEPFFSIALGLDYGIVGSTNVSISGQSFTQAPSNYQSHAGALANFQATQDLGENLSLVLDVRYRAGLQNALNFSSSSNGSSSKLNLFSFALGIQKLIEEPSP